MNDEDMDGVEDHIDLSTNSALSNGVAAIRHLDPACIIIESIAASPFQFYFRRARTRYPHNCVKGWGKRLDAYFWPEIGTTWAMTSQVISGFCTVLNTMLTTPPNPTLLHNTFERISSWGGVRMPSISALELARVFRPTVHSLRSGSSPVNGVPLNSAWTKLYAFALPNDFVIYDSRVATSLISRLDAYMPQLYSAHAYAPYQALGTIRGRGGSRPRSYSWSWPVGYMNWDAQMAANKLCRAVRDKLNSKPCRDREDCREVCTTPWTLREVEAVLFMDGY